MTPAGGQTVATSASPADTEAEHADDRQNRGKRGNKRRANAAATATSTSGTETATPSPSAIP